MFVMFLGLMLRDLPKPSSVKYGIIIAVREEAAAILANSAYQWQKDQGDLYRSDVKNIILAVCGIGKAHTAFALGQMFGEVSEVIMFGTSGGLGQEKIGTLYLCTEFVEHDMDVTGLGVPAGITPFSGMTSPIISFSNPETTSRIEKICLAEDLPLNTGRTISGDYFIHDQITAQAKASQFGAQLADMESAAAAKICMLRKKPFCAVRYISDNADHNAAVSWPEDVKISAGYFDRILGKL